MTEADVLKMLAAACDRVGSQKAWADLAKVSPPYVHDVLKGRRAPGGSILSALGLERVPTAYRKVTQQ